MGEVYRATDSKLGREVALKVLPEAFVDNAERMARFQREAQVLASLNHPNIASIYGLEESGRVRALVMELVEGPTLADRIAGVAGTPLRAPSTTGGASTAPTSAIPIDESLHIAKQIAEALEYAHERGVVHRDLKPANVKVTPDGAVKVLDFGLAKLANDTATSTDPSSSPTLTAQATQAGMIMGTAAYMAPEQARGHAVDRRADIWSFGVVLYEMLAAQRAFEGETTSDILASVLKFDPDWSALPASTPPPIVRLLRRCLTKDRKQRLQAIGEARIAIDETLSGDATAVLTTALSSQLQIPPQETRARRSILRWFVVVCAVLIAGIGGWRVGGRRIPAGPIWSAQMLGGPSIAMGPRISPDAHTLAFQAMVDGTTQVAVMDTESGDWTVLTKDRSRGYVTELNWSPDGSRIYFDRYLSAPRGIYTVSRFGGDEHLVLDNAMGPEVLPDGSLLAVRLNKDRNQQLYRYWPESGRLQALDALFAGASDLCPPVRASHDGKDAFFIGKTLEQVSSWGADAASDPSIHMYDIDLASGNVRRLAPEVDFRLSSSLNIFPLAPTSDDRSVLAETEAGDLYRVISIPRHGVGPVRALFSLTLSADFLDVDKDGNIYLDQADRPMETLRFTASGGAPDVLVGAQKSFKGQYHIIQLPDGRLVFDSPIEGRRRLAIARPGGEATSFIQTKEETGMPACRVGEREIAFILGTPDHSVLALASLADGRVVKRLDRVVANAITALAASPDGKTIYYVAGRNVWTIDADGGQPRQIGPGDAVAPDSNGRDLVVQLIENEGVRLMRVPVSGGPGEPIPIQGPLRVSPTLMGPNAVGRDGRVVVSVASADYWFYGTGILDPRSGKLQRVPINFVGDLLGPGWQDDGRILTTGWPLKSSLWRFRASPSEKE